MTSAEALLWKALRSGKLDGLHFRRQQPIGHYIADFYCEAARLAVELDSPAHAMRRLRDINRDGKFASTDIAVTRIENERVFADIDSVLESILRRARLRLPREPT